MNNLEKTNRLNKSIDANLKIVEYLWIFIIAIHILTLLIKLFG